MSYSGRSQARYAAEIDLDTLERLIGGADDTFVTCPLCSAHRKPSNRKSPVLHVTDEGDGILFYCNHCGAQGKAWRDRSDRKPAKPKAAPERKPSQIRKDQIVKEYWYTAADGELLYRVVRLHPKDFRTEQADGSGGWLANMQCFTGDRVLYQLPRIAASPSNAPVFINEGEKDADRLNGLGHIATTVANGSWKSVDVSPLAFRDVFVLEDNDEAGRKKAQQAAAAVSGIAKSVRIVRLAPLDDGGDVSDWLDADPARADRLIEICWNTAAQERDAEHADNVHSFQEEWENRHDDSFEDYLKRNQGDPGPEPPPEFEDSPQQNGPSVRLIWHGDVPAEPPPYLVDETLPQTGIAILAGQYGVGKTFGGINLAAAIMTGGQFAGREVKRRGGVLWLAAEGQNEVLSRFDAAIAADGLVGETRYPFVRQADDVPLLTEADALQKLKALAQEAATGMRSRFDCDLALIVIDTLSGAAGFDDENSAAETQKVINLLRDLSRTTSALVAVIDHHGKVAETGVRGSSAKSAGADAILAFLGERGMTGNVGNRRMAVAKLRSGPSGRVVHFDLEPCDGTCTVKWRLDDDAAFQPEPEKLPKGLILFKRALDNALVEFGVRTRPFPDGPEVLAVDRERVRAEFFKIYPAENVDAKRVTFSRCEKDAVTRGIIACRDDGTATLFWLAART
jgi:hypothetical protein